jgi:hypothetical protein
MMTARTNFGTAVKRPHLPVSGGYPAEAACTVASVLYPITAAFGSHGGSGAAVDLSTIAAPDRL